LTRYSNMEQPMQTVIHRLAPIRIVLIPRRPR